MSTWSLFKVFFPSTFPIVFLSYSFPYISDSLGSQLCPILCLINSLRLDILGPSTARVLATPGWNPRHINLLSEREPSPSTLASLSCFHSECKTSNCPQQNVALLVPGQCATHLGKQRGNKAPKSVWLAQESLCGIGIALRTAEVSN